MSQTTKAIFLFANGPSWEPLVRLVNRKVNIFTSSYDKIKFAFSHSGSGRCTVGWCSLLPASSLHNGLPRFLIASQFVYRDVSRTLVYHYVTSMPHRTCGRYYHITRFLLLSCSPRSFCPPISCLFLRWVL